MFRACSCPSSGATTTAVAASGLPSELGDSSAAGRGRAGQPDHDQQHCYHQDLTVRQNCCDNPKSRGVEETVTIIGQNWFLWLGSFGEGAACLVVL